MLKLENMKRDAMLCPRCANCKWVDHIYIRSQRFAKICPINARYYFSAYSGAGLLDLALAVIHGQLDYNGKLLDVVYSCTLCGACDVRCKRNLDIEVLQTIEALRARCVEDEAGPLPRHREVSNRVLRFKHRYGASQKNRLRWLSRGMETAGQADVLYFVGCNSSFRQPGLARATARLLASAGVPFSILGAEEWCCGNPLISVGQIEAARAIVEHNLDAIKRSGATTVLTSCAECYKTLKVDYPKLLDKSTSDLGFQVSHITEYAAGLLSQGVLKLSKPVNLRLTYHDPCQLGRLSEPWHHWQGMHQKMGMLEPAKTWRRGTYGVYQPPRDLLQAIPGLELVEMERARDQAWCCGAGNGVKTAFPDFALWTAGERLEEAAAVGAEAIVSACPYCKENLSEAAQARGDEIKVFDVTELMLKALI